MNKSIQYVLFISILITGSFSNALYAVEHNLPLDLTIEESRSFYKQLQKSKSIIVQDQNTKDSIASGERLLSWIDLINKTRSDDQKIRLTSKKTQRGIPIDKPSEYGPSTIKAKLEELKIEMPDYLQRILFEGDEVTSTLKVTDAEFIKWGRKLSGLYQSAVRWTGMQRWLDHYEARKTNDVRGYYHLKKINNLNKILNDTTLVTSDELDKIKESLIGICLNNFSKKRSCEKGLKSAVKKNTLLKYKNTYWKGAVQNWDGFFKISDPRTDVIWNSDNPNLMEVTFKDPKNEVIADWLKVNIEDEFRRPLLNWNLEMRFIRGGWFTAYLEFKKNVTPHVSGGNKVVMDANTDIEEYGVRWTIRHEYGHILRIPDCYHEFYDKERNLMINYQLDVTDLMCSRAGVMNDRIYEELKRVYYKESKNSKVNLK